MLAWLAFIGWGLLVTLITIVLSIMCDMQAGMGAAFGYPTKSTNWPVTWTILIAAWVIGILLKTGILRISL